MRIWLAAGTWVGAVLLWQPVAAQTAEAQAMQLPDGFAVKTIARGLALPTDMVLLPAGDILVTEKGSGKDMEGKAAVRLVRQGVLQSEPVLTLSVSVAVDSGLVGIVLDPDFVTNGYFYLWYAPGESALAWPGESVNRLSRFTFDPVSGKALPTSETIILDHVGWNTIHNGGGLAFDSAGNLLITVGDSASSHDPAQNVAQMLTSLNGKVLRIRPLPEGGYTIPADNPFIVAHQADATVRPEIYAWGLRNPFRITQRANGNFYLLDVGQDAWEEVDLLQSGANYGWPAREGPCPIYIQELPCAPAPARYTDPIFSYPLNGAGAMTALAFYEGESFPAEYRGKLFFADFNSQWMGVVDVDDADAGYTRFAEEIGLLVDMEAHGGGIYLLSYIDGAILYLYYDEAANLAPIPRFSATPTQGRAPLPVRFSAEGTRDPDDLAFVYTWDFGDGSDVVSTSVPTVDHTYPRDGVYTSTLTVADVRGAASEPVELVVNVYSGAMARIAEENLVESGRTLYHGGDNFRFWATRTGGLSGLDPNQPYRWTILQHHNDHAHPVMTAYAAEEVRLEIPVESHGLDSDIWYEVILEMITDQGQVLRSVRALQPEVTYLTVGFWPGGGDVPATVNQKPLIPGEAIPLIVGHTYDLAAPPTLIYQESVGEFEYWLVSPSWPHAAAPVILTERAATVVALSGPQTYTAYYRYLRPVNRLYVPYLPGAAQEAR